MKKIIFLGIIILLLIIVFIYNDYQTEFSELDLQLKSIVENQLDNISFVIEEEIYDLELGDIIYQGYKKEYLKSLNNTISINYYIYKNDNFVSDGHYLAKIKRDSVDEKYYINNYLVVKNIMSMEEKNTRTSIAHLYISFIDYYKMKYGNIDSGSIQQEETDLIYNNDNNKIESGVFDYYITYQNNNINVIFTSNFQIENSQKPLKIPIEVNVETISTY